MPTSWPIYCRPECKSSRAASPDPTLPSVAAASELKTSARKKATRATPGKGLKDPALREMSLSVKRLQAMTSGYCNPLKTYVKGFPNPDRFHPFERALLELTLSDKKYRTTVEAVDKMRKILYGIGKGYASQVNNQQRINDMKATTDKGLNEMEAYYSKHGRCVDDLKSIAKMLRRLPVAELETPTVALVGAPNVGKSSLLNQLAGDARAIVSDHSGTTRDTIDSDVTGADGNKYTLIDTAGIRRRTQVKSGTDGAEKLSVGRALQAMKRADIVVLVIDGTQGPSQQDFVLAERATQEGCGIVLCINKWDLVDKDTYTMNKYTDEMRIKMRVFEYAEIVYTSALTGQRIQKILDVAQVASENHRKRLTTATLNSVVQEATLWKLPPSRNSRKGKIYYITQASIRPPTFVFFVNDPKLFPETYRRYMERQLRENIGFPGTPIRLLWRGKGADKGPKGPKA